MRIIIPFKTPTVNNLYGRNKYGHRYLVDTAEKLKIEIKEIVKNLKYYEKIPKGELFVKVEIYENWYNKDGTIKKKDVANREKFLIDSVFDGLGIDDKVIFKEEIIKIQSEEEKSIITIKEVQDE